MNNFKLYNKGGTRNAGKSYIAEELFRARKKRFRARLLDFRKYVLYIIVIGNTEGGKR